MAIPFAAGTKSVGVFASAVALALAVSSVSALAQPAEQSPAAGAVDGEALTMDKCSSCHGYSRVLAYKRTRAGWSDTVDLMKEKGLELSDAETKTIVDYLAAKLPPEAEAGAAPAASPAP